MRNVKVIFFDIDDTLYSTTEFTKKARTKAIDEMIRIGLKVKPEDANDILDEIISEFSSNDPHQLNKLLSRLPDSAKKGTNELMIIAAGISGYHNTKFVDLKPFSDVKKYLPEIARFPVSLGVISSGVGLKQAEKLIRLDIQQYFDPDMIFITEEIGIGKRNKKLFEYAVRKAHVTPGETMHVGDNPATDIDSAHAAGFVTVLREGSGKHAHDPAQYEPDFRIKDFSELHSILQEEFGLRGK